MKLLKSVMSAVCNPGDVSFLSRLFVTKIQGWLALMNLFTIDKEKTTCLYDWAANAKAYGILPTADGRKVLTIRLFLAKQSTVACFLG